MKLLASCFLLLLLSEYCVGLIPMVVNTWNFINATQKAWKVLKSGDINGKGAAVDALAAGCKVCQDEQCEFTVGYGGSPDENGETTLDALIFDGNMMDMGAVGGIRRIKNAIEVARHVLENTKHSILVGSLASDFAKQMGFPDESLQTNYSRSLWETWKEKECQPNFWKNVSPNPETSCGPYRPQEVLSNNLRMHPPSRYSSSNHDTIGMIVIDGEGHVVAGTSTNGATHKVPGRVGDSPIPGAGAYADSSVGAATATGDGDVMMRFLPSFLAVEQMRLGASPSKAANIAIKRIAQKYPTFFGAVIAVDNKGNYGAACNGMSIFPFAIANDNYGKPVMKYLNCTN